MSSPSFVCFDVGMSERFLLISIWSYFWSLGLYILYEAYFFLFDTSNAQQILNWTYMAVHVGFHSWFVFSWSLKHCSVFLSFFFCFVLFWWRRECCRMNKLEFSAALTISTWMHMSWSKTRVTILYYCETCTY